MTDVLTTCVGATDENDQAMRTEPLRRLVLARVWDRAVREAVWAHLELEVLYGGLREARDERAAVCPK